MKYVPPITITDAVLTSTNVAEAVPTVYNAGTTYAADDGASTTGSEAAELVSIWRSKQAGNLGNTPAEGVWWTLVSTTYHPWTTATYGEGKRVLRSHGVYESLQPSNTNHDPADAANSAWWGLVGSSNQRAMFDRYNKSVTRRAELIDFTLTPGRLVNTIGLYLDGASAQVIVRDSGSTVRLDTGSISLRGAPPAAGWYPFFFTRRSRKTKLVLTNLPPYAGATVQVKIMAPGGTAECGTCVIGMAVPLATGIRLGAGVKLQDYSVNGENAFGVSTLVVRDWSLTGSFNLRIPNSQLDAAFATVAAARASPGLWIGYVELGVTVLYGYPKVFDALIPYPNYSDCALQIKEFT